MSNRVLALQAPISIALAVGTLLLAVASDAQAGELSLVESTQTTLRATDAERSALSATERVQARSWGLLVTEWHRYKDLMAGIRGSVSAPTISPIEVLGIHARDDTERRRYAEHWARLMREDAERILAFQRAYDASARRLFEGELMIDPTRLPRHADDARDLQAGDRILFFTGAECTACDALLERLLARLDRFAGIDVYLSGITTGDEQAVRAWAAARGIQREWVRTHKVTLNFEAGALAELAPGRHELPTLMRRRGESITVLPGSAL